MTDVRPRARRVAPPAFVCACVSMIPMRLRVPSGAENRQFVFVDSYDALNFAALITSGNNSLAQWHVHGPHESLQMFQ